MASDASLTLLQAYVPTNKAWLAALKAASSPEALIRKSIPELHALGLPADGIRRLKSPDPQVTASWQHWLDEPGRAVLIYGTAAYPKQLEQLPDAPIALWVDGPELTLLEAAQFAIVGSRNPSKGGRATAEDLAFDLSDCGITITSGLAVGIDGASHVGALRGVGRSIAVLGCGIDIVYPRQHRKLAQDMAQRGLLVSEYPPGTLIRQHQFPQRNRIIAGLSLGTLVVEATRRSGALITARLAADYGRDVFAVPGSIHNPLARGCHALIRDGAKLVEEVGDILVEIAPQIDRSNSCEKYSNQQDDVSIDDDPAYTKLLDLMGFEPLGMPILMERTGLTAAELSSMLLLLELGGAIEALPGARYCRLIKRS